MYTVKQLNIGGTGSIFQNTDQGHENRDMALSIACNLASELAKEKRARIRSTCAYIGYLAFIVENSKERFGGYAVYYEKD